MKDIRYALRTLARSPGYTAIAIGCLALGIGANTTIFSAVNTMLLRAPAFPDPDRLIRVYQTAAKHGIDNMGLSLADYRDLKAGTPAFSGFSLYASRSYALAPDARSLARPITGSYVSWDVFNTLQVKPVLGRLFSEEESVQGRQHVVLMSDRLWRDSFRADPKLVGRTVTLDGLPYEVVGIMPPVMRFPDTELLWTPIAMSGELDRGNHAYNAVARLAEGASQQQAAGQLATASLDISRKYADNRGLGTRILRFQDAASEQFGALLWTMLGAVGFVLLIACANVANLLLGRATGRAREIAVRTALGGRRSQIIRQLLIESVLVALGGALLGILLAVWSLDMLVANIPYELPYWMVFDLDSRVLGFTLALAVGTGILFGLVPALHATSADLQGTLRDGGRGSTGGGRKQRLRSGLVVSEVALCLVLLVGASLMMRSFLQMQRVAPGFRTTDVLTVTVMPPRGRYDSFASVGPLYATIDERIRALPGVSSVAAVSALPLSGNSSAFTIEMEGIPVQRGQETLAHSVSVDGAYFHTLDIPLVEGRDFTDAETRDTSSRLVIVNQTAARKLWPAGTVVGRRLRASGDTVWSTVIGVVGDVKLVKLSDTPEVQLYFPHAQGGWRSMTLVIGSASGAAGLGPAVRSVIQHIDPAIALTQLETMGTVRDRSMWQSRVFGAMFLIFGGVALALAVIGIYGVMSYAVGQRTHEIGIRMALGAKAADVQSLVVGQGARMAGIGVGIGLALALVVSRVLRSQLFGVSSTDVTSYAVITLVLVGTALLASWIPARRAASVDPVVALRHE